MRLLLSFVLFGWLVSPAQAAFQGQLKILTLNFNDETTLADSKYILRDLRFTAICDWITKNDPDVILLQEDWNYRHDPAVALTIGRAMGYDVAYRLGVGLPHLEYDGNAILTKKRYAMSDEHDVKLPHSAPFIGDGKTWVVSFGAASWAVGVKLKLENGEPLYLYTSHLIGSTMAQRRDQIAAIDAYIRAQVVNDGGHWETAHVIVAGDTNSNPNDPAIRYMSGHGYVDTWAVTHPNDTGFSDCSVPQEPWFNPMSIGGRQFPSQNDEDVDLRDDYILVHSPDLAPLASTLVFTVPYKGVWMSDHYGLFATVGTDPGYLLDNPARDSDGSAPPTVITTINDELWNCDHSPGHYGNVCDRKLPDATVTGPRGFTFLNRSSYEAEVTFSGPGPVFTSKHATLGRNEQGTFAFLNDGDYSYRVENVVLDDYRADFHGVVHVRAGLPE